MIDIPEEQQGIPDQSQYQDPVQTVTYRLYCLQQSREDTMTDIPEPQLEPSDASMDP